MLLVDPGGTLCSQFAGVNKCYFKELIDLRIRFNKVDFLARKTMVFCTFRSERLEKRKSIFKVRFPDPKKGRRDVKKMRLVRA